jgi:hypothetical protein
MLRQNALGRVVAVLGLAGAASIGTAGCVLVPAPVPAPIVVAPRPPVVVAPYGYYGYGWRRW